MISVHEMALTELMMLTAALIIKYKFFPKIKNDFLDLFVTWIMLVLADLAWTYWAVKAIQAGMVVK